MPNIDELKRQWLYEESIAHVEGWDFSHIEGRYKAEPSHSWSYEQVVRRYLAPRSELLDIDTGGGEFLLSLGHHYDRMSATEAYPPNAELCERTLTPLGVRFRRSEDYSRLPFGDASFDIIIDRHGEYRPFEIYRLLKPGGVFVTEQVGELNNRELIELLLPQAKLAFPGLNLRNHLSDITRNGFEVLESGESLYPVRFYDVGALVWYAHVIEWEFSCFSVEKCMDGLLRAQALVEEKGCVEGRAHRFMLAARKPA